MGMAEGLEDELDALGTTSFPLLVGSSSVCSMRGIEEEQSRFEECQTHEQDAQDRSGWGQDLRSGTQCTRKRKYCFGLVEPILVDRL